MATLKIFVLIVISVAFSCVYPIAAQESALIINKTPTQQETKKANSTNKNTQPGVITTAQEKTNHNSAKSNTDQNSFPQRFLKFSFTDLLITIFTFLLAEIAVMQYKAFKKTQRAFVFLKKFNVTQNTGPYKISIFPEWENNGTTQANYIWGWVEYNDIFDKKHRHRTEFCSEVLIDEHGLRIAFHNQHNGADDYCLKKPMTKYVPRI